MDVPLSEPQPVLIADLGGTNLRLAVARRGAGIADVAVHRCADFPSLAAAVGTYLGSLSAAVRPKRGAIAVACSVMGDEVRLTNLDWWFSITGLQRDLAFERLDVINDFAAIALAVPHLGAGDLRQLGGGTAVADAPIGIIGPGTGLGVTGLIRTEAGDTALSTEGGHTTLPAMDDEEAEVIKVLRQRFGHVSAERTLSGPGLVNLHQAMSQIAGRDAGSPTPDAITAAALADPASASGRTVEMFCRLLGTVAADLALSLGARGGVYIAGGIVGKLGPAFDRSGFRARFEQKGRFSDYLAAVPTFVITEDQPALRGLAETFA